MTSRRHVTRRTNQQEMAAINKEMREKVVEEVKVKLEKMSTEEANEVMDEILSN